MRGYDGGVRLEFLGDCVGNPSPQGVAIKGVGGGGVEEERGETGEDVVHDGGHGGGSGLSESCVSAREFYGEDVDVGA